ncbi:hypothetical protein PPERSA_13140 [Pseudocohnilembus persalinus]|uniref:Transmembrane protein n=1 Tax=Pseudocohnilembus persalinus TaxID=266149 RepID=A0A0V0QXP7_PSEPJ|nr:hypothetical protein PPERSA_13140 [Pseudocohnilembus persalinus]|eukprot:KRX06661.1 hypothetical protein PPERSA_13140 [Pseudocohnilembus persalinus]
MEQIWEQTKWILAGNIYNENFEETADGGPTCYAEMTNEFRFTMVAISVSINLFIVTYFWKNISKSTELDLKLVKNLKPSYLEKLVGYISFLVYLIMVYYKVKTGKLVFMLNPCHMCVLQQAILLTTKKTKFTAGLYIQYMRWMFGPFCAIVFPVLNCYDQPFEVEMFYIEHYLAIIGPFLLIGFGRYGFFKKSIKDTIIEQYWGFAWHSLWNRVICFPICLMTWANINFNLCKSESDPWIPLVGNYYLYWVDQYLNLLSLIVISILILNSQILRQVIILPLQKLFSNKEEKLKIN